MSGAEAYERVKDINRMSIDDEAAHAAEDKLWEDVLTAIARADDGPHSDLARVALTTKAIKFARWCA